MLQVNKDYGDLPGDLEFALLQVRRTTLHCNEGYLVSRHRSSPCSSLSLHCLLHALCAAVANDVCRHAPAQKSMTQYCNGDPTNYMCYNGTGR